MKDFKKKDLLNVINVYQQYTNEFININDTDLNTLMFRIIENNNKFNKDLPAIETTPIHKEQCWNCKKDIEYTDIHAFCPECLTSM